MQRSYNQFNTKRRIKKLEEVDLKQCVELAEKVMTNFKFIFDWRVAGNDAPELRQTMAMLQLNIDNVNLMKNLDIWSKSVLDHTLVSAYPLALWVASSWWRLNWEPLPAHGAHPSMDWRMAHELGAANKGLVWPQIIFASDREVMQAWAVPMNLGF
jgi:hypothetical protein